jgi:hypothetical protein
MTREQWQAMVQVANDSAATEPVDWNETTSPHFQPSIWRRWLWHFAIPIGEIRPGVQEITAHSGTALTRAGAKRKIARLVTRHFDEAAGRDPHGRALDEVRRISLCILILLGFALFMNSLGCGPSALGGALLVTAAVGIGATLVKARRARGRHRHD